MEAMVSAIAWLVYVALYLFFIAMWVRFIMDWVQVFSRSWRPRGPFLFLAEASYSATDRPLRAVRRVIPPLRIGGAAIDLGWSLLMIGTLIVMSVVGGFR
jgi:YggT family protein